MTATALDRARREFEDALNILHKYSDKHGCSMGVPGEECHERKQVRDTVSRLEAAAREDALIPSTTLEKAVVKLKNLRATMIKGGEPRRGAFTAAIQELIAAARLAGRVEQAERCIGTHNQCPICIPDRDEQR